MGTYLLLQPASSGHYGNCSVCNFVWACSLLLWPEPVLTHFLVGWLFCNGDASVFLTCHIRDMQRFKLVAFQSLAHSCHIWAAISPLSAHAEG